MGGRSGPAVTLERRAASEGPEQGGGAGAASLRPVAAGLEGSDAHPAIQTPEANAIAPARCPPPLAAPALPGSSGAHNKAPSNPAGRRGGVRPGLGASRCRALRPDRVCHATNKSSAISGGSTGVRQCALNRPRVPHRRPSAGPRQRSSPEGTRHRRWLGVAKRNRAWPPHGGTLGKSTFGVLAKPVSRDHLVSFAPQI